MKPTRFTNEMIEEYFRKGIWSAESSVDVFERNAEDYSSACALKDSRGQEVTWLQLKIFSDRIAVQLTNLGYRHDDTMVVQMPNLVENGIVRVALMKAGLIAAYPPMTMREKELEGILQGMGAKGYIVMEENPGHDFIAMARALRKSTSIAHIFVVGKGSNDTLSLTDFMAQDVSASDLTSLKAAQIRSHEVPLIQATSGTTGLPKLCEWPDAPVLLHGRTIIERMRISTDDVLGILAPLSGGPGLSLWNAGFQVPCKMILQERSDPEADLKLVQDEGVTIAGVVPAQIIRMIRHPDFGSYDLKSLRAIRPGGAPMSPTVAREIEEVMPWCKVVVASGTSESMTLGHTHIDDSFEDRLLTVGRPWLHCEVKIVDEKNQEVNAGQEGVIRVRGGCTGGGYFRDPEKTREVWGALGANGWYDTGDIGRMEENGNLKILGRKKEIIIRGGQNIYPKEVEDYILQHPKVIDAAVLPMPDAVMGEKACAFVITKGKKPLKLDEVKSFLDTKKIAKYKYPERLVVLEQFPVLGTGKIDRKQLSEWAAQPE